MLIRVNLLAHAQAQEALRRRTPVKVAAGVGIFLVCLMLAWSASVGFQAKGARSELSETEGRFAARSTAYQQAMADQRRLAEANWKLAEVQRMATNRLLCGTLLNALQQTTMDDVQLLRLKLDQSYVLNEELKASTNDDAQVVAGRPATVTERTLLHLDARDSGPKPGDRMKKFKRIVADSPYFREMMGSTNSVRVTSFLPPSRLNGSPSVDFSLECQLSDQTR